MHKPRTIKRTRTRTRSQGSQLEARFLHYWQALDGPPLERELQFHPTRRWRADFAHPGSRTLIEIEGGVYVRGGGRHNRAAGFIADTEKYLEAFLAGWSVIRLTSAQITAPNIERIIAHIRRIDIGVSAYGHSPRTPETRHHTAEHERTHPVAQHP